jgi:glycosyltransferase involved in cell wall biosynthesis
MKMKVSVIVPCYNFEEYIEQSLLSAVSQKTNFE